MTASERARNHKIGFEIDSQQVAASSERLRMIKAEDVPLQL
jgi:hypothetical protein